MDGKIVKFEIVNVGDGNGKFQDSPRRFEKGMLNGKQCALDEG